MSTIRKYPRTPHILDSASQAGDADMRRANFEEIAGRNLVVEEKIDGANAAISFSHRGRLQLQSRGHFLTGGGRERQFDLFKSWTNGLSDRLWRVLQTRYIVYGEWVYAKHTIFYDALPHYFLEFDVPMSQRMHSFPAKVAARCLPGYRSAPSRSCTLAKLRAPRR